MFPQGYNQRNNDVVEQWSGTNSRQSYSYLVTSNSTVSFTWAFQHQEESDLVRLNNMSQRFLFCSTTDSSSVLTVITNKFTYYYTFREQAFKKNASCGIR